MTSTVPDFYGVPAVPVVQQVDTITLSHTTPAALSRKGITSYPALETAGAAPDVNVIAVYDVTTSTALVFGTDYTLTATGAGPTLTYTVTRVNASTASADADTATVTYRYGTVPDLARRAGEYQGYAGAAPTGTAFQAAGTDTTGTGPSGLGTAMPGGSTTDPAAGKQASSETGSPGSEYTVAPAAPATFGWAAGAPDTEGAYGGGLPSSYVPADTSLTGVLDTTIGGGAVHADGTPPVYRAPTSGVAAGHKDTTLTEILGNQINATPVNNASFLLASQLDTGYIGAPAAPTALATQSDAFPAAVAVTHYYLSQTGLVPSSIVVTDNGHTATQQDTVIADHVTPVALSKTGIITAAAAIVVTDVTTSTPMVKDTDYTLAATGAGATLTYTIVRIDASTDSSDADTWHVSYTWADAAHFTPSVLVKGTDYAVTTAGNGATTAAYIVLTAGTRFTAADDVVVAYSYGDPTYWDSNTPAAVPGAPSVSSVTAENRGVLVAWTPPTGTTPVDYYLLECDTLGTMFVPGTGQPVLSGQPSPSGGATTGQPTYQADTFSGGLDHTTPVTLTKTGIITDPKQLVVRDTTSAESDPMQPGGTVLEYGYDYTVTVTATGPWSSYTVQRVATSVNSADGDTIIVEYWYGADPSSVSAYFTQGLVANQPVIYSPDGTTRSSLRGYRFHVAAGNRAGLGPYSAWSSRVVPLNFNAPQPGHEGQTQTELALDPANSVNPVYAPDGTVKSGTGLGG